MITMTIMTRRRISDALRVFQRCRVGTFGGFAQRCEGIPSKHQRVSRDASESASNAGLGGLESLISKSFDDTDTLDKELKELSEDIYANEIVARIFVISVSSEYQIQIEEMKPKIKKKTSYKIETESVSNPFL